MKELAHLAFPQVGVNLLQDGNAEGGRLPGSRLGLGDHVHTLRENIDTNYERPTVLLFWSI
jgi:hypothetical protein